MSARSLARAATALFPASISLLICFFLAACADSKPNAANDEQEPVRLLLVADPFGYVFEENKKAIEEALGFPVSITLLRYGDTLAAIHRNAQDLSSYYHVVSFDVMWLGDLVKYDALAELGEGPLLLQDFNPDDYFPLTLEAGRLGNALYGLPIQPHTELLWYRKDLLEAAGFQPPQTFDALLEQARYFHDPQNNLYGICWNGLRGDALGQTVAHLYAANGQLILDQAGELQLDNEAGRQVAQLLLELKEVSPPDILTIAWDQRVDRFAKGEAVFTYGWAARNQLAEADRASIVRGKIGYTAPPVNAEVERTYFPLGQWSLGIPKNLPEAQHARAVRTLEVLTSLDTLGMLLDSGIGGLNRSVLPPDMEVSQDPTAKVSRALAESGQLSLKVRPPHPQWPDVIRLCGVVFHDMLKGRITPDEALQRAQAEGSQLLNQP